MKNNMRYKNIRQKQKEERFNDKKRRIRNGEIKNWKYIIKKMESKWNQKRKEMMELI